MISVVSRKPVQNQLPVKDPQWSGEYVRQHMIGFHALNIQLSGVWCGVCISSFLKLKMGTDKALNT
jgi:hypothetical protein